MAEIAVTSPLPGDAVARLAARHHVRVARAERPLAGAALADFVGGAAALVCLVSNPVDAELLAVCPGLQVVANVGVGVNNIDLDAARAAGVWVSNTPDVLTEATADFTWELILAVTRRLGEGERVLRSGHFSGWRPDYMLGIGLQSRTLGIVGMGRIGQAVARRAGPFGVRVAYHARAPREGLAAIYFHDLDGLLGEADIVSLHTPLTPTTRHLIDARRLAAMKPGAFLVNTSRGEVVDEAALAAALEQGHLAGAALDVYEREPEVHPGLLARENVVLAPHLGSATLEARTAMANLAADNALAVLDGREPPTPVVRGKSEVK